MDQEPRFNKYMPVAVLYFFFNGFLLPLGLLYTTLLTPLLLIWLSKYSSFRHLGIFFLVTIPFGIVHFMIGVDPEFYLRSYLLLFTVYVFGLCFYQFLKVCQTLGVIYRNLLILNSFLVLLALVALFIPGFREILWTSSNISYNIEGINRLKLLTYEPSYYSTLLAPIALYYYLKAFMKKLPDVTTMMVIVSLPLVLSFSFGVILGILLSLSATLLLHANSFFSQRKMVIYLAGGVVLAVVGLAVAFILIPDNIFFQRITNIFEGRDTSFRGRTYDALYLGRKIAEMKSLAFGSGLGQVKVLGLELWTKYYQYEFTRNEIAIPNAVGETLAVYGLLGVFVRIGLQIYLFFKTRVYSNHYRLALFIFIFVYQFTGSFLFNIAEYVIWILAFSSIFNEFNKNRIPA
jgi:hypothetical protein